MSDINNINDISGALEAMTIPTGFPFIDDSIGGWHEGELITVAARPAVGKTALALECAYNIAAKNDIPVLFFSLELGYIQIEKRLNKMHSGYAEKGCPQLYIDDTRGLDIQDCENKIKEFIGQHGKPVVFIDYIHLMCGPRELRGRHVEEVGYIVRKLKLIAKENSIPIMMLCQMARYPDNIAPSLNHIRYSSEIETCSDAIFIIADETDNCGTFTRRKKVIIAKSPNGTKESFYGTMDDLLLSDFVKEEP